MFAIFLTKGMDPFYQNITSFPTVFFTFFLLLTLLYWLVAVLGVVSIDILDFDVPEADGAWDINADSDLSNPDVLAGIMLRFGLQGVPVTIIVSLIALFGWLSSYYMVHFLLAIIPAGIWQYIAGIPVLIAALYIGVMITAQCIKPLRPFFKKAQQQAAKYIVGQLAVVRTSRVDNAFGEAILEDGGAGLILKVRTSGDDRFVKGDKVILLKHIKEKGAYLVTSEQDFMGSNV